MDVHASEKEQVEALKKWWKDNSSSVVTGILLGLSVLFGGKAWLSHQEGQALNASAIYSQMIAASDSGDAEKIQAMATELVSKYNNSIYASLAALQLARQAVEDGNLDAAQAQLQWVLDNSKSNEILNTTRLRLARILIDQKKYDDTEKLIASVKDAGTYAYLYSELQGDLAMARGEHDKAATAYQLALQMMPPQAPNQALLSAKYENVSTVSTKQ